MPFYTSKVFDHYIVHVYRNILSLSITLQTCFIYVSYHMQTDRLNISISLHIKSNILSFEFNLSCAKIAYNPLKLEYFDIVLRSRHQSFTSCWCTFSQPRVEVKRSNYIHVLKYSNCISILKI